MTNFDNCFTNLKLRIILLRLKDQIFRVSNRKEFNELALLIFKHQIENNLVYQQFCNHLGISASQIKNVTQIPFLPVEFFKTHEVKSGNFDAQQTFLSSGTTGQHQSKHFVKDLALYERSYLRSFQHFYGDIKQYCVLALLPSYIEREGSSLIYMVEDLIRKSNHPESGFFLDNQEELIEILMRLVKNKVRILLVGVSFALLDLAEQYEIDLRHVVIMETGGMKGRRKELIREELHQLYKKSFNVSEVHSEYGMTELLSQAYSKGNGIFKASNWMKIFIRDINDPFLMLGNNRSGGVNIIDLANIDSCSFIATKDLGRTNDKGGFEILGRFDDSDLRGCNLLIG